MPRWAGTADSDWYPWLRAELDVPVACARLLPTPQAPAIADCVAELATVAGRSNLEDTLLVGHSVGCQAVLRFVADLPEAVPVGAILCVAGWFAVDAPWDTIRPWMDTPLDDARIRAATPNLSVLLSDDDPFTADHEANTAAWRERLGAHVTVVAGARHFNAPREPDVLRAIERALAALADRPPR